MSNLDNTQWLRDRPDFTTADAAHIANTEYGLDAGVRELGSQQDRNFLLRGRGADGHVDPLMLKIYNGETPVAEISLQEDVIDTLIDSGIHTPAKKFPLSEDTDLRVTNGRGDSFHARAYQFIEGTSLNDIPELTGAYAERLGELAGATASALASLTHPAAERNIQWDLRQAQQVTAQLLHHLPADRQTMCSDAVAQAQTIIDSVESELTQQVIHGDITCDNVMLDSLRQLWLLDYGDVAQSWRVAELAVTVADIYGRTNNFAHVERAVHGYSQNVTLTDAELTALWPLVVLRGAVLAVSGWSQITIDPDNSYAHERLDHEWQVFTRAIAVDPDEAVASIRLATRRPHRAGITYADIIEDFSTHTALDFSVTSEALDRGRWLESNVEAALAAEAASQVTLARFGEARLTRTNPDVTGEAFTRARGIQLWAPEGSSVRAPFTGTLSSTHDGIQLRDTGVVLSMTGVAATSSLGSVTAGSTIATTTASSIFITRQFGDHTPGAPFGSPEDEYTSEQALDPSVILGVNPAPDGDLVRLQEQTRRDHAMGVASERYYADPPHIERGWQSLLVSTTGRAYLDMVNNVTAIGHSNPVLADRVARQLNLLNTNSRFLYSAYADFTEKLLAHSPDPTLDTVIPVNSGSEALDLAIRLAQIATGRQTIIVAREGYHGWTMASDAVSTSAFDNPHALESRPDWVELVDTPNAYRGTYQGADAAERYVADAVQLIEQLVAEGRPPAAFLCEPVLGNAGGVIPPDGYLEGMYRAIRSVGGLVIADEVQVGYGRLGQAFWGSEMLGATADIIATAKAAGNAYPIGALLTQRAIVEALQLEGMFFSSAGGAPASAVAGAAVLDEIDNQQLQEHALQVGSYMIAELERLALRHPIIGAVHGSGLYVGIELVRDPTTKEPATEETAVLCERLLDLGVVMQATSERQNVLKVKPPMVVTSAEIDMFITALDQALAELN